VTSRSTAVCVNCPDKLYLDIGLGPNGVWLHEINQDEFCMEPFMQPRAHPIWATIKEVE
jgi:hypothetical protein